MITILLTAMLLATAPAAADPRAAERGRLLMARYHCGTCHTVPGVAAARGTLAASLESFGRRSYIAGRVPNTGDHLERWIVAPAALVPDTTMPAMGLSRRDAADIAAYLRTLR
jgi:cytochrome c